MDSGGTGLTVKRGGCRVDRSDHIGELGPVLVAVVEGIVPTVYEVLVAPAMSVNVTPPSVETCHWTVGAGSPVADAVNVADCPVMTVDIRRVRPHHREGVQRQRGRVDVAVPAELVNTA